MVKDSGRRRRNSKHNKTVSIENKTKKRQRFAMYGSLGLGVVAFLATTFGAATKSDANPVLCQLGILPPDDPACLALVPEISALEGTAAVAVVLAALMIAWERRRGF